MRKRIRDAQKRKIKTSKFLFIYISSISSTVYIIYIYILFICMCLVPWRPMIARNLQSSAVITWKVLILIMVNFKNNQWPTFFIILYCELNCASKYWNPCFKLLTHFRVAGVSHIHTCAINWMIFTKILRGMSLGTTLRLPLGNKVEVMDVRRLGEEGLSFY